MSHQVQEACPRGGSAGCAPDAPLWTCLPLERSRLCMAACGTPSPAFRWGGAKESLGCGRSRPGTGFVASHSLPPRVLFALLFPIRHCGARRCWDEWYAPATCREAAEKQPGNMANRASVRSLRGPPHGSVKIDAALSQMHHKYESKARRRSVSRGGMTPGMEEQCVE
jgi:hypothetical protein